MLVNGESNLIVIRMSTKSAPKPRPKQNLGKKTQNVGGNRRTRSRKIKHVNLIKNSGMNPKDFPPGTKYVGWGDYSEQKGRALYDKKKAKKNIRKTEKSSWWNTLSDMAGKVGPLLGKAAMGALTGFGDYEVSSNSVAAAATGGRIGGEIPLMENSHCANIVHHREYIGPVYGSTTPFALTQVFPINPGMKEGFPWLAPIAACYTRYRMRGAVVIYEPLASDYTTAGSLGFVALASQYNPLDAPFTSKREMLNHEYSCEAKPSKHVVHPIECAPKQLSIDEYYLRDGPPPANADIRFYDLCTVSVATGGNPVSTQIGDLWITYEVEFYQPKINPVPTIDNVSFYNAIISAASDSHPLGGTITPSLYNTMSGASIANGGSAGTDFFVFPNYITSGIYKVDYTCVGSATVLGLTGPFMTPYYNCIAAPFANGLQQVTTSNSATSQTAFLSTYFVIVTGPSATVLFQTTGSGGLPTSGVARINVTRIFNNVALSDMLVKNDLIKEKTIEFSDDSSSSDDEVEGNHSGTLDFRLSMLEKNLNFLLSSLTKDSSPSEKKKQGTATPLNEKKSLVDLAVAEAFYSGTQSK